MHYKTNELKQNFAKSEGKYLY